MNKNLRKVLSTAAILGIVSSSVLPNTVFAANVDKNGISSDKVKAKANISTRDHGTHKFNEVKLVDGDTTLFLDTKSEKWGTLMTGMYQNIKIDNELKEFFDDPNWKEYVTGKIDVLGSYVITSDVNESYDAQDLLKGDGDNKASLKYNPDTEMLEFYTGRYGATATYWGVHQQLYFHLDDWNKDNKAAGKVAVIERKPKYHFEVGGDLHSMASVGKDLTDVSETWFEDSWIENSVEPTTIATKDNQNFSGKTEQDRKNEHQRVYTTSHYTNGGELIAENIPIDEAGNWTYKASKVYPEGTKITAKVIGTEDERHSNGVIDKGHSKGTDIVLGEADDGANAENTAPTITASTLTFAKGQNVSDGDVIKGATATDKEDGSIDTNKIYVKSYNGFSTATPGTYHVTLGVKDSKGLEGTFDRTVIVKAAATGSVTANSYTIKKDQQVTGTVSGDVKKVKLRVNGTLIPRGDVSGSSFTIYAKDKIAKTTDNVEVVGYDADGTEVSGAVAKVNLKEDSSTTDPVTGSVQADDYTLNTDNVTGKVSTSVKKLHIQINGKDYAKGAISADGTFKIYAKGLITSTTDNVKVIGYDAKGNAISGAQDTVKILNGEATTGSLIANDYKLNADYVTGKASTNVKKLHIKVNNIEYAKGAVSADGSFKIYAKGLIASTSDSVKVIGYDAQGKAVSGATDTVTITK